MSTWYLGPLGDLRPLVCPEPNVRMPVVRYGGVHQGLSGARVMDVTGHRQEFEFVFEYLDQDEYVWLEALHARLVPGAYYLLNPLKRNRLTLQASNMIVAQFSKNGVRVPTGASWGRRTLYPTAQIGMSGYSVFVWHWTDSQPRVTFDRGRPIPVLPNETVTASVYLNPSVPDETPVTLQLDWFDVNGDSLTPTVGASFNPSSGWNRYVLPNAAPPSGAVSCRFSIGLIDPDQAVYIAAPQVEAGPQATAWEMGGAALEVLPDQLETESPRFPLRNATLTLLEA